MYKSTPRALEHCPSRTIDRRTCLAQLRTKFESECQLHRQDETTEMSRIVHSKAHPTNLVSVTAEYFRRVAFPIHSQFIYPRCESRSFFSSVSFRCFPIPRRTFFSCACTCAYVKMCPDLMTFFAIWKCLRESCSWGKQFIGWTQDVIANEQIWIIECCWKIMTIITLT